MAAGSVMVIMTSLTSSIGMSPITRIRLASSRVSGILRFSPAQPKRNRRVTRQVQNGKEDGGGSHSKDDGPVMVSAPPLSMLLREDMLLRPLGSDGEPETAAGLITAAEKPLHKEDEILPRLKIQWKRRS